MNQELYNKIGNLIPKLHGWCDVPKAITLANLVLASKPTIIVEIGAWGGRSVIPMALACKQNGFGTIICIDPWDAKASAIGQTNEVDKNWWGNEINHELVYQHFLYNLKELKLESLVEINRVKSDDYEPPSRIDLLHIDGNHGPEACTDTMRYAAKVTPGGFCVLDDLHWAGGYVEKSAEWLKANGFIELHPVGTGAVYLRTQ